MAAMASTATEFIALDIILSQKTMNNGLNVLLTQTNIFFSGRIPHCLSGGGTNYYNFKHYRHLVYVICLPITRTGTPSTTHRPALTPVRLLLSMYWITESFTQLVASTA